MSAIAETSTRLTAAEYAAAPDDLGRFGIFGGSYIPETLHHAVAELAEAYEAAKGDPSFAEQMQQLSRDFIGRATPLQFAERLTEHVGGAKIYFKREDLAHTGAHKINNAIGQCLLAIRMGKKRIIAETGAGQHGTATATAAARFGLECEIFMGAEDMRRQRPNVLRMELLGAKVTSVESGAKTLKDATNAAMRDWMASSADTHYIIGSVVGPHPFPMLVRDFQSVIGNEAKQMFVERNGGMPDAVVAVVGGGSNAAGMFYPFVTDEKADGVRIVGVEPGGTGSGTGQHAAAIKYGEPGVLHGSMSYVLQDPDGQTQPVHSISAGLDYPGIGPEHAWWHHTGRVEFVSVTDREALETFALLCRLEGIIPALEPSHAVCHALKLAKELGPDQTVLVNLCGRGDKDLDEALRLMKEYGIEPGGVSED